MAARAPLLGAVLAALIAVCAVLATWRSAPRPAVSPAGAADDSGGAHTAGSTGPVELAGPRGGFPTLDPADPAEVRLVVGFCADAGAEDLAALRHAALHSENPLVVGNAVKALGRLKAVMGDDELLALLDDERPRVRDDTVVALGNSADPRATTLLVPLLGAEGRAQRTLVIQALGKIGTEEARAALEQFAPRATDTERAFLRQALADH